MEVVESFNALRQHASPYHELLDASLPDRAFFYRVEQMSAMASIQAGARRSLFLLLAWRDDMLVGALPLVLEKKSWSRARVRRLTLWGGDGSVTGMEGDIPLRGSDAESARTVQAFRDALAGPLADRFDELELGYLRGDSPALPLLASVFEHSVWSDEALTSYSVDMQIGAAQWSASRSRDRIRRIKALKRRLEALGPVTVHERTTLDAGELALIAALHGDRQSALNTRGKIRESPFADPEQRATLVNLLNTAAEQGKTRHRLLFAGDHLVAFRLAFVEGTTMFAWMTAMHDGYAQYSPGSILLHEVIEREFALGAVHRIEMGLGHTFLKETMATHTVASRRMLWQPPNRALARFRVSTWRRLVALRQRLR